MKEIALACTGGGAKAAVNIGAMRALEKLDMKIVAISGASIGASVAILYAMRYTIDEISEIFSKYAKSFAGFTAKDVVLAVPNLLLQGGVKNPTIIQDVTDEIANSKNMKMMSDLKIPTVISALDTTTKETIYYSSVPLKNEKYYMDRPISEAIKSSCSIPVIFIPNKVDIDGHIHHMMDGGVTNNSPVVQLKEFSDFVIGIGTKYNDKEREKINLFTNFTRYVSSNEKICN